MTVRFDLQNQLDEVTQLQRLPESLRRLVGDKIAVFCHRQQFIATAFAGFGRGHFTRQGSETFNVFTDCHPHDINRFQELLAVQIFQHRQVDARATFHHFLARTIKPFFQQQREIARQVRIAGSHIALRFNDSGRQQTFLLIGKHAVATILYRLTAPPRAHFMQNTFVLFAHRKTSTRTICQIINLFFDPGDGIFREDRRGANFACLVANDQLIVLDPDSAIRQVMRQCQRATYRDRLIEMLLIHLGIVLRALGTDWRFHNMHQRIFVRFNAVAERVQFQCGHGCYPRKVAVNPFWQAYCWAKSSSSGASSGFSGAS